VIVEQSNHPGTLVLYILSVRKQRMFAVSEA